MRIIFLGSPGSGKGTYSSKLEKLLGIPHISMGKIFREEVKQETGLGNTVSDYMKRGELVPDEIAIEVLKERITQPDCSKGFILDGYPRTIPQAEFLNQITNVDIVFNLNSPDDISIKKLSARRVCKTCGEIYNIATINDTIDGIRYYMPAMHPKVMGVCDRCGSELEHRKDDEREVIKKRFEIHRMQTEPLIEYYRRKGLLEEIMVNADLEIMVHKIMVKLKSLNLVNTTNHFAP